MLGLLLIVLVVGMGLTMVLWAGSAFLQGYFYTEPSPGMAWQAPAVGAGLTLFLMLWCLLNANSPGATASQVPYDALFRAQSVEDYTKKPADRLWSYRKGEAKPTEYTLLKQTGNQKWDYVTKFNEPWRPNQVEAIELPDRDDKDQKIKFERRQSEGPYAEFVSPDGWVMKADNNIGLPNAGSWGRFLLILFLNLFHFALWFVGLWLVLRYQWFHALGLAFVLWLVMTVAIVPMLLNRAGAAAEENARNPSSST